VTNLHTHTVDLASAIRSGALRPAEAAKRLVCRPYGLQKDTANADLVGLSKPEFHIPNRRIYVAQAIAEECRKGLGSCAEAARPALAGYAREPPANG
jgi:hypothetical protein